MPKPCELFHECCDLCVFVSGHLIWKLFASCFRCCFSIISFCTHDPKAFSLGLSGDLKKVASSCDNFDKYNLSDVMEQFLLLLVCSQPHDFLLVLLKSIVTNSLSEF